MKENVLERQIEVGIAYIHGRIEAQIENFAFAIGIPARELAERVGALLLSPPGGKVLGTKNSVSSLLGPSPIKRKSPRKMAVASDSHSGLSHKGTKITHPYWSKLTPEERKAEMKRRRKVTLQKQKAA